MEKLELLGKNIKSGKTMKYLIHVVMVLFTAFYIIKYNEKTFYLEGASFGIAGLAYSIRYIPLVVLTALGGNLPGMVCVLIVLIHRSIISSSFSYMTFIYLLVVCVVDQLSRRKFFKKWQTTLLVSVLLQLLVGNFWGIILILLSDQGISGITGFQQVYFFLNEMPGCIICSFIVYYVLKWLPDEKKLIFGNGKYYVNPELLSDDERYVVEGRSRLSFIVMNIIIVEALVIGLAAEMASNSIMPNAARYSYDKLIEDSNVDLSTINSSNRIEAIVSRQLDSETKSETEYFAGTLTGRNAIDYRFSVQLAMLISLTVIPMAVFLNRYAQKRIASPIRQLSSAMSNIYNSKDFSLEIGVSEVHDLNIDTKDEIEELYHSVDLTLYRLVEYVDLVKTRQNIEDQLQVARSANEAKSRFLSSISHEIRTPINAVLGFDEMILRESKEEATLAYARDIQSSGKTLLALINDILDFSKIEAGKMEIVPVEYELGSMLNDLYNMSEVRAKEKNLRLTINVNEKIPHILYGDEIRIKQCILNIVTNAVKYTEYGSVTLDVDYEVIDPENPEYEDVEDISLKIRVRDTGIGIREEDMDKLMSAFERIDVRRNRTVEGTGLGISIVVSLLEMMDSKLEVDSEYGKGSEFSFAIKQRVVDWDPVGDFASKAKEAQAEAGNYKESFHAENAKILVVDDTRTNLMVIKGLLKQTRMQVDTATSGMDALEMVKNTKYNIIFLDHRMPEMDGIQTLHAMEEMEGNVNKDTPVIALTANAISGSREMYLREGFTNYMSKPVDPVKLEEMILAFLPEDLVCKKGDEDFDSQGGDFDEEEKAAYQELLKLSGVDIKAAIERCGSAVVARDVMKDFWLSIDEKAGAIERYEMEKNIKDFTIYVHGLKSSAKAIGALDLSEKAKYLEACGNGGDIDEIEELTPGLLTLYRSYIKKLEPLMEQDRTDKPEIGEEDLEGAFASIKEFVSASYFDSADDIMKMLEDYSIPEKYRPKYHDVKRLLAAVDRDGLLNIL
jgi:signal transduction histidine kinase/CheY-like chemotaxis protein